MEAQAKEALRQQMLLRALLGDARPGVVAGWLRAPRHGPTVARGLAAYRAHAGHLSERALAAAFPTVQQLLGEESFALLARDFWRQQPPQQGDLATWGAGLPAFIAQVPTLAEEAYLPDTARLEWALHRLQAAADAPAPAADGLPPGLPRLATHEPAGLWLQLPPGSELLVSRWPVFSLWQAHRAGAEGEEDAGPAESARAADSVSATAAFAAARAALAAGRGEQGLLTREGWAPRAWPLGEAEARFVGALLAQQPLAAALDVAGTAFDFQAWLIAALQRRLLVAVSLQPTAPGGAGEPGTAAGPAAAFATAPAVAFASAPAPASAPPEDLP